MPTELVLLYKSTFEWEIQMLKLFLQSHEVDSFQADYHLNYSIGPTLNQFYRLMVRRTDYVTAGFLLNKFLHDSHSDIILDTEDEQKVE